MGAGKRPWRSGGGALDFSSFQPEKTTAVGCSRDCVKNL